MSPISPSVPAAPLSRAAFNRLSKANQRKAIARDVLSQLKAKTLEAITGSFFKLSRDGGVDPRALTVSELLKTASSPCQVCALGSILASQVKVNGDCKVSDLSSSGYSSVEVRPFVPEQPQDKEGILSPFLSRYFTVAQLQLIEMTYERGCGAFVVTYALGITPPPGLSSIWHNRSLTWGQLVSLHDLAITKEQAIAAVRFGRRRRTDLGRLVAIMNAIISNPKGEFVP